MSFGTQEQLITMVKVYKNTFKFASQITWDDVVNKMDTSCTTNIQDRPEDFITPHIRWVAKDNSVSPTFIMLGRPDTVYPATIARAYSEISSKTGAKRMDVYVSFSENSQTYGRHKDKMDVLITQAIGKMSYKFDDGAVHTLHPGDAIFIPAGTYHDPIVHGSRVTLSISQE